MVNQAIMIQNLDSVTVMFYISNDLIITLRWLKVTCLLRNNLLAIQLLDKCVMLNLINDLIKFKLVIRVICFNLKTKQC